MPSLKKGSVIDSDRMDYTGQEKRQLDQESKKNETGGT
jgi:hypothetical protein